MTFRDNIIPPAHFAMAGQCVTRLATAALVGPPDDSLSRPSNRCESTMHILITGPEGSRPFLEQLEGAIQG
ncbi:hypothetical protein K663_03380 [Sphingobium sp. MI1205]|nr:hypothetical protein K663_03380 [Sphingobium sp. MI1205]